MDSTAFVVRLVALRSTYERLSREAWQAWDVTGAIRYRGMAEAYTQAIQEVAAFAQRQPEGGEGR